MYSLKDTLLWAKNHAIAKVDFFAVKKLQPGEYMIIRTRQGCSQILRVNCEKFDIFV